MEYFYHRFLFISIFFIVSILATEAQTWSPGPSPPRQPTVSNSPNAQGPELSPVPSSLPPSSPRPAGEVPVSLISNPPESSATQVPASSPGPSPTSPSVSSPHAEPEVSPTSSSLPPRNQVSARPSLPAGSEESPEAPDGEMAFLPQSDESESEEEESGEPDATESDTPDPEPKKEIVNANPNANAEVMKVCGSTDYPTLCVNTIDPLVKPRHEVSLDTVLEVSIKATNDLAKVAQMMAKKIASNPGTPPELASVLKDCEESFDDALDNFQKAMEAYDTRDIGTMNTMLSAVITDIGDCSDEFSSLNIPSPISKFAEKLTNMTSNCLAIVSLLQY